MDHPPGTAGRTDVTVAGDAEVTVQLDAAKADLQALTSRVEALGVQARTALAALNGTDTTVSEAAIEAGNALVADLIVRTAGLRTDLASVPYVGTPTAGLVVSEAVIDRHAALVSALDATAGLDADWARLTAGSVAATRMSGYLAAHDRLIGEAVARAASPSTTRPSRSSTRPRPRSVRRATSATISSRRWTCRSLDEWLDRNGAYDVALKDLYLATDEAGKKVTKKMRAAIKAEEAARAKLPPDPSALVIIMADIGRVGMNGAVIGIEEARGRADRGDRRRRRGGERCSGGDDRSLTPAPAAIPLATLAPTEPNAGR